MNAFQVCRNRCNSVGVCLRRLTAMSSRPQLRGDAAGSAGASRASGYRWLRRYWAGGWAGLHERPSTPKHQPRRLSTAEEAEIVAARERSGRARSRSECSASARAQCTNTNRQSAD